MTDDMRCPSEKWRIGEVRTDGAAKRAHTGKPKLAGKYGTLTTEG